MEKNPERNPAFHEICRLAGKAVGKYRMIQGGEKILVGLSGGKDSLTLAHVLSFMRRRSPVPFELAMGVFDPGFPEFGLEKLQAYCDAQSWKLEIIHCDMPTILREKAVKSPCMMCSRLRRGHLYKMAESLGCTHLALGQHLDDIEASFLMSLARGQGLTTMGPHVAADASPVRVIRPLALVPEALIRASAEYFDFPGSGKCSHADALEKEGDRAYFKGLLDVLEKKVPHVRSNMLRSLGNIQEKYLLDERFL